MENIRKTVKSALQFEILNFSLLLVGVCVVFTVFFQLQMIQSRITVLDVKLDEVRQTTKSTNSIAVDVNAQTQNNFNAIKKWEASNASNQPR